MKLSRVFKKCPYEFGAYKNEEAFDLDVLGYPFDEYGALISIQHAGLRADALYGTRRGLLLAGQKWPITATVKV